MQNCKRHLSKDLTRGTRLVQPRSSTIGKRSVVPKQREPLEKHRSTKPSTSIALKNNNRSRVTSPLAGKSPGLMQQHEQAARRRPMHPKVIGFFRWIVLLSKTPVETLRENKRIDALRDNKRDDALDEPVPPTTEDQTEGVSVENEEEDSGIDMEQLRAMMASDN
jgi:hypothetical protein